MHDENCLNSLMDFFSKLKVNEKVCARFGEEGFVPEVHFMNFHTYLDRATCWESVSNWKTVVTYVIQSGDDHLYVRDTERGQSSEIFTHHEGDNIYGTCVPANIPFTVHRFTEIPYVLSTNLRNYKWVIVESKRTFVYRSASSAWSFTCSVTWEGESKHVAETSERKFCILVESEDTSKFTGNLNYGCASLCEKIIDVMGRSEEASLKFTAIN
ncbi:unnamed protein product [Phaeothamnion confervicola]